MPGHGRAGTSVTMRTRPTRRRSRTACRRLLRQCSRLLRLLVLLTRIRLASASWQPWLMLRRTSLAVPGRPTTWTSTRLTSPGCSEVRSGTVSQVSFSGTWMRRATRTVWSRMSLDSRMLSKTARPCSIRWSSAVFLPVSGYSDASRRSAPAHW
jgi:hypothetical protein